VIEIVLFRHGPAEDLGAKWPADEERPLSAEGKEKTALAAAGLLAGGFELDRIVSSPLVRAEQTARILGSAHRPVLAVEVSKELAPGGDSLALVREIARSGGGRVALVGHEPSLSRLLSSLTAGEPGRLDSDFKKAGAAVIEISAANSRGTLVAFLPPRLLRQLAG